MLQIAFLTSFVDFSFICFAFYIDILIDYFFHITCVFLALLLIFSILLLIQFVMKLISDMSLILFVLVLHLL